jgi:hypothetical protein
VGLIIVSGMRQKGGSADRLASSAVYGAKPFCALADGPFIAG